ncbi:hypothetical protein [Thermomonospora umbrina]|uniref:Mce-associated membrane protein n=1 Tax=Thermomonospora umbrina TaxID=111806 RepID=A0A3D9SUU6_9ACTN|nr:hypothetical protein [Thermomonospora umbrina]REE97813.1 Mce-associated membrane protein [Thermomonospora umbrina]
MRRVGPVLVVVAAVFLGFAAWSFWQSGSAEGADLAKDRDLVLKTGKEQVAALNSMDVKNVDDGLRRWLNASTGALHDQYKRESAVSRQKILGEGTSAAATVVDAAVTTLDRRAGNAQIIASLEISLTPERGAASVQRKRYEAGLTRTSGGWKIKSLTVIPVGAR